MGCSITNPNPQYVRKKAAQKDSQSNGSLMRITPLAIFCSQIDDIKLFENAIRSEVSLTHSSLIAQNAAICYCLAIKTLINENGDRKKAYEFTKFF